VRKPCPLRRTALVVVDDPSQDIHPMDSSGRGCWGKRRRALLAEALMWTAAIEEGHVRAERALQMAFADDQEVVQTLLPCRSYPALRECAVQPARGTRRVPSSMKKNT
jgi:hypothetical protein